LKNYYIKEDLNLRFSFDLLVNDRAIIEIKSVKRLNDSLIRNLLIKSRLIRYQVQDGRVVRAHPFYKMNLVFNGSLEGPTYDKMRYLRMLTASGWDLYPISTMDSQEALLRMVQID
jgi:hypothetical protein